MRIFKWLRKLVAREPRFVRIPDRIRIVGATFYVPDGMWLDLGNYVVLKNCIVIYGEATPPEEGDIW